MRRRSERKKSTDVSSPAVARRSGRRSRKSPSISESEKNAEEYAEVAEESAGDKGRASSEEPLIEKTPRRGRTSRRRTPVNERSSPSKRKNQRTESPETTITAIPEEENGGVDDDVTTTNKHSEPKEDGNLYRDDNEAGEDGMKTCLDSVGGRETNEEKDFTGMEVTAEQVNEDLTQKEVIGNSRSLSPKAMVDEKSKTSDVLDIKEDSQEDGQYGDNDDVGLRSFSSVSNDKNKHSLEESKTEKVKDDEKETRCITEESRDADDNENKQLNNEKSPVKDHGELDSNENSVIQMDTNSIEPEKPLEPNNYQTLNKSTTDETVRTRKRKWLTKKTVDSKAPILAISTDSLKGLISDVHPVPLSDVRLDSSPEIEEVASEREEGEETPSPEHQQHDEQQQQQQRDSVEKIISEKPAVKRTTKEPVATVPAVPIATPIAKLQRSPSPARNKTCNVLYITNLVRPFTVLQLKGLLARTGKIVEDGFWIDRIKSKCYVQYENEDEAIETRHALHGVRWPVSNPKCLNVDFGSKVDMDRAVESTKEEGPKSGADNKDNVVIGIGWNRGERIEEIDRKNARPVREWDVGKKENLEREKNRDDEKRRSRERDRDRGRERERERERERDHSSNRENDKGNIDHRSRNRGGRDRSRSLSHSRKIQKKENEPPLRLLDDLFRKTKAAPCVYWLPLTPEQIAEKEAFRQKRIQEHKERMKQREIEREAEREKERNRGNDRDRDRDRDRRNRSTDRRRSRSRDRRRY